MIMLNKTLSLSLSFITQARVQGMAQGAWAPGPLEIEKQKKKVIRTKF